MKKVYIVGGGVAYAALFAHLKFEVVSNLKDADILCFTGGEDVHPSFYEHKQHETTHSNIRRDQYEADIFNLALSQGKAMVGICRGGQFLNVMSGGEMYQHVTNHCGDHSITDLETGEVVWVSSTHHQMMKPSSKGVLVASSGLTGQREWWDGQIFKKDVSTEDIEVVYYPETNCLCFQPHPEFGGAKYTNMQRYFMDCMERFLIKSSADNLVCGCC